MLKPQIVTELQDMRHLEWSRIRKSSGSAGSYLKAYELVDGRKVYYKLSLYDSVHGITGHESVNEIIVDRLLSVLGIEHLSYQLIHSLIVIGGKEYETYICASEDFKEPGDSKIPLDDLYELSMNSDESIMDFIARMKWSDFIYKMIVVDFLILNRDRHGANIEIIKKRKTNYLYPAPIFDHGISLIYNCKNENEVTSFDVMEDRPVQCYVGSRSAKDNLGIIPIDANPIIRKIEERDRDVIFDGLEGILPPFYYDKIWNMIWERWCYYENLRNKG